jgi:hypothetical protein
VRLVYTDELGLSLPHIHHPSWDEELLIPVLPSSRQVFICRPVVGLDLEVLFKKNDCWRHGSTVE